MKQELIKVTSIRRFLLVGLLSVVTIADGIMMLWSYQRSHYEATELQDGKLAQYARSLAVLIAPGIKEGKVLTIPFQTLPELWEGESAGQTGHKYEAKLFFQILNKDRQLLSLSESAPSFPLHLLSEGFQNQSVEGKEWRLFVLFVPELSYWIVTAQRGDIRSEMGNVIAIQSLLPFLFVLPLAFFFIGQLIHIGLKPITRLASELESRAANNLKRVDFQGAPLELLPLINSTNSLLNRLNDAFDRERRFASDAAHELRTPLAGMGIHLENALTSKGEELKETLQHSLISHRRMVRLVEQLLLLAKTTPDSYISSFESVNLQQLCQKVIAENISLILKKDQQVTLEEGEVVYVRGHAAGLEIMLTNLVVNASLYTPEGGSIELMSFYDHGSPVLSIGDSGPGIPSDQRARVFDRFYRGCGDRHQSNVQGSGLGLSIVGHIARLHHADVTLGDSRLGGLEVKVNFKR